MAGEYVEFVNNSQPALNEDNLNLMQQRIKQDIQGAVSGDTLPVGAIMSFGSDTIPENWLLCNGQAVSRTEYQQLFNTIGITFGQGDGFTTFNLPNLQGRFVVGKDANNTDFDVLGETDEGTAMDDIRIARTEYGLKSNEGTLYGGQPLLAVRKNTETTAQTLEDNGINFLPPYQVQNYIIKAKQSAGVVATVVDSLNSTSATDALSAKQGRLLKGITLFEDANGLSTNITLNETAANFDYIEIFYARKGGSYNEYSNVKVLNPNEKYVQLSLNHCASDSVMQIFGKRIYIDGTSIAKIQETMVQVQETAVATSSTDYLYIFKVIGYKY